MPVVEMIRWPWIEIASAPPAQSAFTTAWMSCWWMTSQSASMSGFSSSTFFGASWRVTVMPGPDSGVVPTCWESQARRRVVSLSIPPWRDCRPAISPRSAAACFASASLRRLCSSTSPARVVFRLGRRSVPRAFVALVANSSPASISATGAPARHSDLRVGLRTSRPASVGNRAICHYANPRPKVVTLQGVVSVPESKNTSDTSDETVEPVTRQEDTADEVVDEVDATVDDSEIEGELVDVPEELQDLDDEETDDEAEADDEAETDNADEAGDLADEIVAPAPGKAGKAAEKAKPGKTVKPPKARAAEKAKKKQAATGPRKMPKQRRWVAPLMLASWLLGLAWLVVFYVAGNDIPYMKDLGNWNLLVGMGLIAFGFVVSTQWV